MDIFLWWWLRIEFSIRKDDATPFSSHCLCLSVHAVRFHSDFDLILFVMQRWTKEPLHLFGAKQQWPVRFRGKSFTWSVVGKSCFSFAIVVCLAPTEQKLRPSTLLEPSSVDPHPSRGSLKCFIGCFWDQFVDFSLCFHLGFPSLQVFLSSCF